MRMYPRTSAIVIATLVASCAVAKNPVGGAADARGSGSGDPDARVIQGHPDAMPIPDAPPGTPDAKPVPDAMPTPDAKPGSVTMTQSNSNTITQGNTVSCNDGPPFYDTAENSYYRAFKLSDFGVTGALTIQHVDFAVEQAISGGASQSVNVKLYTYTGATGTTLNTAQMTLIGSKNNVNVPDTSAGEMISVPITATAPAGSTVVFEVFIPDGTTALNTLFLGSNTSGETAPGYIRAPTCSTTTPTAFASLSGAPVVHLIMSVTGTY